MNDLAMKIKHPKLRGEWAEMRFMAAAAEHGLHVTKPWGETLHYDFALEHEAHFVRVQVKSTGFKDRGGYACSVRGSRGKYVGNPFDFLAAYIVPEDVWFIIPESVVHERSSIVLYPNLEESRYKRYLNAWDLLKEAIGQATDDDGAAAGAAMSTVLTRLLRCAMCAKWAKCCTRSCAGAGLVST